MRDTMESSDISSILNSMVAQVEEKLSPRSTSSTNIMNGGGAVMKTFKTEGPSNRGFDDGDQILVIEKGEAANRKRITTISSSSAGNFDNLIVPTFGASKDGHDLAEQVQNNISQLNSTQPLPPVNLSNVFSDSCEIDMSDTRQNEAAATPTIVESKSSAPSMVQINTATAGETPQKTKASPRISISVSGVNLNILKRPDSPGSPFSPSCMSHPSPSSLDDKEMMVVNDEKVQDVKPGLAALATDEDTQDVSVLFQVPHSKSLSNSASYFQDSKDSLLKKEQQRQSLADTENNNDGHLNLIYASDMQQICVPSSSSVSIDQRRFNPPRFPAKDAKPCRSLLKRRAGSYGENCNSSSPPKKRRSITFDGVTVFYFPRTQGFQCVPSQGGSTLGMASKHVYSKKFSLQEWAAEQRRMHKQMLLRMRKQQQEQQLNSARSQQSVEEEAACSSNGRAQSSDEEEDSDGPEIETDSELEAELDGYYFLQPVPTRQRRLMLREAGVKKIDSVEKDECRDIRSSREFCGCSCKLYCDPDTCSCAQADIKCQVDRANFPCQGCTRDGCGNANGRVEFNPVRVRTHFIHTLMRLELEKKHANQANCGLDVDGSSVFSPSLSPITRHPSTFSIMTSGHDLSYGVQQNTCPPHWDSTIVGTSPLAYYKRADDSNLSNSVNYNGATNLVRDVSFSTGMELESCVSMGSYTNFHYNTRTHSQIPTDLNNFVTHDQHQNHSLQFPSAEHLSSREDSFDLYSTLREDSYSENSENSENEFSNESGAGDQRTFPPTACSTNVFSGQGHTMNMIIPMNHSIDGGLQTVIPDQNRYDFFGLNHEAPILSVSDSTSSYHATMLPDHLVSPLTLASHHHNTDQRLYNIMGGTDQSAHYNVPNSHYIAPYAVSSITSGCVYPSEKSVENHISQPLSFSQCPPTNNSAIFTEINNDPYSKVGLCNEQSLSASSYPKNGFQSLHLEEDGNPVENGLESNEEDVKEVISSDNFGEIIKKSMVESVSA